MFLLADCEQMVSINTEGVGGGGLRHVGVLSSLTVKGELEKVVEDLQ